MAGTFVPVDLDQVLDEFEEQEMKNGSPPKTNVNRKSNDSLDTPHDSVGPHLRFPSADSPRTYSFNSPIDAMLENHTNDIDNSSGTSLALELAGHDFESQRHDHDHEEMPGDENDVHNRDDVTSHVNVGQNTADDGNDSETASEASSTSAVIAAAEKITEENNFSLQKSNPSTCKSDSMPFSLGTNTLGERPGTSALPSQSVTEQNKNVEVEPDFLSVLNSAVEEKSMCLQGSKSQTASFSSVDGSTSSSTELDEIKDILVDKSPDPAAYSADEMTRIDDSKLNISDEQGGKCSTSEHDSTGLYSTDDTMKLSNKNKICGDNEGDNVQHSEERTSNIEGNFYSTRRTIPSGKVLGADVLPGTLTENVLDDADKTCPTDDKKENSKDDETASCSSSKLSTDNKAPGQSQFFSAMDNEPSASEKCIESWEKESTAHNEESEEEEEEELAHVEQPNQQGGENLLLNLEEETSLVNPVISADSVVVGSGLPQEGSPEDIVQNAPSLLENELYQEPGTFAHRMSPVSSGSADSLCGTQDEDVDGRGNEPAGVNANEQPKREETSDLDTKMSAVHISSGDPEMGFVPPIWVPDDVATHCMTCGLKFSVIKRKHHCRACGKVLCSSCCNMKFPLPYMGNKDARVCQVCCDVLIRGNQRTVFSSENIQSSAPAIPDTEERNDVAPAPDHDGDDGAAQAAEPTPLPPADQEDLDEDELLVQALGGSGGEEEQEGDAENNLDAHPPVVSSLSLPSDTNTLPFNEGGSSASLTSAPLSPTLSDDSDISFRLDVEHVRALIPQESSALPPVLNLHKKAIAIKEHPDPAEIMYRLKGKGETVIFLLNKNLIVKVKIVKLRCCVKKKCWCFVTDGMGAASQEEMVVLLECHHNENTVPKDVLSHFNTAFSYAKQGHVVSDLGFTIFGQPFLGSSGNAGFLYIKPTFQCLENLPLPSVPYVVGILIQRQEAPWAQLFPLRLMLRLGTEFRYYPCPLWSVRNRQSVYGDIGHTIMNLLTDFKNFQYSIPRITGLIIHMQDTKTTVCMPQDRYDEIVKVLNAAEEHMFAFGANFSSEADSHLVCIQEGETYKTQAINIQNKTRKVTGASFIVFTGSLKTSNPNDAKVSIIEDGLMIQMLPDAILELRKALREMQDYVIQTGSNTADGAVNQVSVEWVTRDANQQAYTSPIDGQSLTNVPSIQVHSSCDFTKPDIYRIRWTNVFLERNGQRSSRGLSSRGLSHLTAELARACCEALRPHLVGLFELDLKRLSLRVNIDTDSVEYSIGSNEDPLPSNLMADLDSALIPAINTAAMKHRRGPLTVELFFSITSLF